MSDVLAEQRRYYAARAPEYDDWWFRRGRYALEADAQAQWDADVAEVEQALAPLVHGSVLELAAGTGIWTRHLARGADRVVAVDANPETLALNSAPAEHVVADIFDWRPTERFDLCFFGFWLSHVPDERFDEFWALVRSALRPGGRVFLVDSGAGDPAHTDPSGTGMETRRLADGREFRIVKRYWSPAKLAERVPGLDVRVTANGAFLYGGGGW
jgi:demethylmenaquinone methyltransferase/2-methoxy-6-polyprenyl-1,4-benzoquinol methylase